MSKTPINNLTKEQFLKEFNEGMSKIPPERQIDISTFLFVLLQRGELLLNKYLEFTN